MADLKRDFGAHGRFTSPMPFEAYGSNVATITGGVMPISHAAFGWTGTMVNDAEVVRLSARSTGTSPVGIMYLYDGRNPTQLYGHLVPNNERLVSVYGNINIQRLRFISADLNPIALTVTLEK